MSQYNNGEQRTATLRYPKAENHAPAAIATGVNCTAFKIIEVAQESNISVFQDDALTSLLSQMNADAEIPPELYQVVADLYLHFLNYGEPQAPLAAPNAPKAPSVPEMPNSSEE